MTISTSGFITRITYCESCWRWNPPLNPELAQVHDAHPFHRIKQWTGLFFEKSALHMTGLQLQLGHDGRPCPSASTGQQGVPSGGQLHKAAVDSQGEPLSMNEDDWEDIDEIPLHLQPPAAVPIKLCRLTSNVFPHLVPNRYWELLRLVQQWCLLKLLKWNSFQKNMDQSSQGDLALFCLACLQPGINVNLSKDLEDWKYTQTFVMDGNFKAEHMHEKRPDDQQYVKVAPHISEKSACNNHRAITQANITRGKLSSTGIGATWSTSRKEKGCRQLNMDYSLSNALSYNMTGIKHMNLQKWVNNSPFLHIPSSLQIVPGIGIWHGSGWVDGEIIETLWSTLNVVSALTHGMSSPHRQELLDFQMNNSNFMKMICIMDSLLQKLKAAQTSVLMAREAFNRLDEGVPSHNRIAWDIQAESALNRRVQDASVMDIFKIQLTKVRSVELRLLQSTSQNGTHRRAASWLTRSLAIEEAEIMLSMSQKDAYRLTSECSSFIVDGQIYLDLVHKLGHSEDYDDYDNQPGDGIGSISDEQDVFCEDADSNGSADDAMEMEPLKTSTLSHLPLPSNIRVERCHAAGVYELTQMELQLQVGQANDALHGLHLALADKAVVFRGVMRQAKGYSMRTHGWQMELLKCHLSINMAAFTQNAHDHHHSSLPWFWTMDIERDTRSKTWLTEFYCIHWLRAKAIKDQWEEEEALLVTEFQWAINFFKYHVRKWSEKYLSCKATGLHGAASYAAKQQVVYDRMAQEGVLANRSEEFLEARVWHVCQHNDRAPGIQRNRNLIQVGND
ncbi:hypothetical protein EDD16DRAFT_1528139 [Pisolithus croceorrhizus]|nr:hypothetical protein EDD16DRAFT_1528139 [Pisolithus croceorrhizus]